MEEKETVSIEDMFEFMTWKDGKKIAQGHNGWYEFKVSSWELIGDDKALWKKFQEEKKQKVK